MDVITDCMPEQNVFKEKPTMSEQKCIYWGNRLYVGANYFCQTKPTYVGTYDFRGPVSYFYK